MIGDTFMIGREEFEGKSNEELLEEYSQTKNHAIKQEIVLRYVYLVKSIAIQFRNIYSNFTQIEDIVDEGIIALMKAVDKYDPSMNTKFETFVSKRLKGLIIDIVRKQDWVPRTVRKDLNDIDEATKVLYEKLGRYPKDQEMADYLNISIEKYLKIVGKSNIYNLVSLDYFLDEQVRESVVEKRLISREKLPEEYLESQEVKQVLKEGLLSLKKNEQIVLSLYYRKELTMREIAEVMNLSKPRISQIHANALRKLRIYIEKNYSMEGINSVSRIL